MWPTNIDAEELKVRPTGFVVPPVSNGYRNRRTPGPQHNVASRILHHEPLTAEPPEY